MPNHRAVTRPPRWRYVAAALACAIVGATANLPAAGATTSRYAPTCAGLGRFTGRQVWINTAGNHQLVRGINSLICSAADGATIDLKSWFLVDDGPLVNSMVSRLRLMHRYHHVRVNVLVGYAPYHSYRFVRQAFPFAHLKICHYACLDPHAGAVSHSKWMTVSRLRKTGKTAVLSTSTNWSFRQFNISESGLLSVGDRSLYDAFVAKWSTLSRCATSRCATPRTATWGGRGLVRVMFSPTATGDPIAEELSRAACGRGGSVRVSSLFLSRAAVVSQLEKARARGCTVRVLLGVASSPTINRALVPHIGRVHDKMLLIFTPRDRVLISGSANLTTVGLRANDEQLVRVATFGVCNAYRSFFDFEWSHAPSVRLAPVHVVPTVEG